MRQAIINTTSTMTTNWKGMARILARKHDMTPIRKDGELIGYKWTGPLSYERSTGTTKVADNVEFTITVYPEHGAPESLELVVWGNDHVNDAENIGLEYEEGKVVGYDGIMTMPDEALALLHELGIPFSEDLIA